MKLTEFWSTLFRRSLVRGLFALAIASMLTGCCEGTWKSIKEGLNPDSPPVIYPSEKEDPLNYPPR